MYVCVFDVEEIEDDGVFAECYIEITPYPLLWGLLTHLRARWAV